MIVPLFIILFSMGYLSQAQVQEKIVDVFLNGNFNTRGPDMSGEVVMSCIQHHTEIDSPLSQIFLIDRSTNKTILISRNSRGEEGDKASHDPQISRDGSYVVFSSVAANLIDNDQNLADNTSRSPFCQYRWDTFLK